VTNYQFKLWIEELKILIWAITKSDVAQCQFHLRLPAITWLPQINQIVIDYHIPYIELHISYGVRSHWENRNNPNYIPDFFSDIPF
jgi:hypothetical protein